jgi:hypothetical protein
MDNGNCGPGNRVAQDFERSMTEVPQFNPETLPTPDDKEKDFGGIGEVVGNNANVNDGIYIDPSMLGASTVQATAHLETMPELGEIVTESNVGMKSLSEAQISGTDVDTSKFQKNGVSKELEQRLDNLKKEPNLYKQSVDFMLEAKKSLASSFADRNYLLGGQK